MTGPPPRYTRSLPRFPSPPLFQLTSYWPAAFLQCRAARFVPAHVTKRPTPPTVGGASRRARSRSHAAPPSSAPHLPVRQRELLRGTETASGQRGRVLKS